MKTFVALKEYLSTSYDPDFEYVDGPVVPLSVIFEKTDMAKP